MNIVTISDEGVGSEPRTEHRRTATFADMSNAMRRR
jgi:purine-nucleoside phosphorylase